MNRLGIVLVVVFGLSSVCSSCKNTKPTRLKDTISNNIEIWEDRIEDIIEDDQLEDQLLLILEQNRLGTKRLIKKYIEVLNEGRGHPEYTREQMREQMEEYAVFRKGIFMEMAQSKIVMRGLLTKEQWDVIFAPLNDGKEGGES